MLLAMRWLVVVLFLLTCGIVIAANARIMLRWIAYRERSSLTPVIGGVSGSIAFLLLPGGALAKWSWIPLIVDCGSLPLILGALWLALKRRSPATISRI
jgi:hypothetical protein